jgi:putative lipoic acid-binding regulatory protein
MTFPCDFALKVMGENNNDYAGYVLIICQKHVMGVTADCLHTRPSRNGKYIAVTVQLIATSRQQLDDLYRELNAYSQTKMAL